VAAVAQQAVTASKKNIFAVRIGAFYRRSPACRHGNITYVRTNLRYLGEAAGGRAGPPLFCRPIALCSRHL
jgi:hypothetical protein